MHSMYTAPVQLLYLPRGACDSASVCKYSMHGAGAMLEIQCTQYIICLCYSVIPTQRVPPVHCSMIDYQII